MLERTQKSNSGTSQADQDANTTILMITRLWQQKLRILKSEVVLITKFCAKCRRQCRLTATVIVVIQKTADNPQLYTTTSPSASALESE